PRNAYARSVKPPTAQAKEKAVGTPNGTVLGTLTINGRPVKLRYVYARKRLAPPPGPKLLLWKAPIDRSDHHQSTAVRRHADQYPRGQVSRLGQTKGRTADLGSFGRAALVDVFPASGRNCLSLRIL